jgi:hypothetical protein
LPFFLFQGLAIIDVFSQTKVAIVCSPIFITTGGEIADDLFVVLVVEVAYNRVHAVEVVKQIDVVDLYGVI